MRSITDVIRQFKLNWTDQLDGQAITTACQDARMSWLQSTLNPVVTVQIFFLQVLHGNTACEHLSHLARIPFTAAAYCKARMPLTTRGGWAPCVLCGWFKFLDAGHADTASPLWTVQRSSDPAAVSRRRIGWL